MGPINPLTIAMMAGSTIMQGMAQRSAEKRQKSLSDAMTVYRMQKAGESQEQISKFLETIQPGAKEGERAQVIDELSQGLSDSVGAVRKFEAPQQIAGKVSDDYLNRRASNDASTGETIKRAIEQLSVIGAPGQTDMREARRYGQAATGVQSANQAANNVSGYYQQAIGNVRPDPFLSLGSQVAAGLGMASAMGGLGKKPAPAPTGGALLFSPGTANYGLA